MKRETIQVRIDAKLKRRLLQAAEKTDRTLSSFIRCAVRRSVERIERSIIKRDA